MLKKILLIFVVVVIGCLVVLQIYNRKAEILYLSNDSIEVGILPNASGRVVIFKTRDGDNTESNPRFVKKKRNTQASFRCS